MHPNFIWFLIIIPFLRSFLKKPNAVKNIRRRENSIVITVQNYRIGYCLLLLSLSLKFSFQLLSTSNEFLFGK